MCNSHVSCVAGRARLSPARRMPLEHSPAVPTKSAIVAKAEASHPHSKRWREVQMSFSVAKRLECGWLAAAFAGRSGAQLKVEQRDLVPGCGALGTDAPYLLRPLRSGRAFPIRSPAFQFPLASALLSGSGQILHSKTMPQRCHKPWRVADSFRPARFAWPDSP